MARAAAPMFKGLRAATSTTVRRLNSEAVSKPRFYRYARRTAAGSSEQARSIHRPELALPSPAFCALRFLPGRSSAVQAESDLSSLLRVEDLGGGIAIGGYFEKPGAAQQGKHL